MIKSFPKNNPKFQKKNATSIAHHSRRTKQLVMRFSAVEQAVLSIILAHLPLNCKNVFEFNMKFTIHGTGLSNPTIITTNRTSNSEARGLLQKNPNTLLSKIMFRIYLGVFETSSSLPRRKNCWTRHGLSSSVSPGKWLPCGTASAPEAKRCVWQVWKMDGKMEKVTAYETSAPFFPMIGSLWDWYSLFLPTWMMVDYFMVFM